MHEFLLYGQVPPERHDQVLQLLAGFTASQPVETCEQTLIYQRPTPAPNDAPSLKKGPNASKQPPAQQSAYVKFFRDVKHGEGAQWTQRIEELPAAGIKEVISRQAHEQSVGEKELEGFRQGRQSSYKYIDQSILSPCHRYIYKDIIVKIFRVLVVPEGTGALEPLDAPVPILTECELLDKSGHYIVEACLRCESGSSNKLLDDAVKDMVNFKKQLEGAINFTVPNRLALDTRRKD